MSNEVFQLSVKEITEKYSPVYPDDNDWKKTVDYLYAEEGDFMELLWEALKSEGVRDAIILKTEEGESFVADGTHRVAAALKNGLETLPVCYGYTDYDELLLEAIVDLKGDERVTDEEGDVIMESLRSFRLDSTMWVTCDTASSIGVNHWEFYLNVTDISLKPKLEKKIKSIFRKLLPNRDFEVTVQFEIPYEDDEANSKETDK